MSNNVRELVERAGQRIGSEYKLAKLMEVPQSHISNWKAGDRVCSPADRARLAAFAGEDALQELVRATLENAKGDRRREQLAEVLGKASRATGAVIGTVLLALVSLISLPPSEAYATSHDV